jgi:RNA-binding motif X-linked protein 2
MNALTQIKNTQKATRAEIELGIGDKSSWHSRFKHSAYVYAGGLPFELTEGDILAVFSQYGEIVDIHLVRDKKTGKSRGFAFLAYEDQRSTVLAVDNLSGARVTGRTIRVEHVDNYRKKRSEVEGEPIPEDSGDEGVEDEEVEERRAGRSRGEEEEGRDGAAAGDDGRGEAAAWTGGNSMFDLMAQAKAQGLVDRPWRDALEKGAGGSGGGVGEKEKDRKKKKEKKEKRHKHKKDRSRSRSRSPRRREHRSRRDSRSRDRVREEERERRR